MARVFKPALVMLCATGVASQTSPIDSVITLLEDLKASVTQEGQTEATTYDAFACFCKDTTVTKSDAIKTGQDTIDTLSADIEENTATKAKKSTELQERQAKQEELAKQLEEETTRCAKEEAEFEEQVADLTKAVGSLERAIGALEAVNPSLVQQKAALSQVSESVEIAEALGLLASAGNGGKAAALNAFIQQGVDPSDPEYKYHSSGVIETLKTMLDDFKGKKTEVETARDEAKTACDKLKKSLGDQMEENGGEIDTLKTDIDGLTTTIAEDRGSLVQAEDTLKDDQLYLKDLTVRCESAAKEWDQRSASRADELEALSEALTVLKDGKDGGKSVKELDAVNQRAFVQKPKASNTSAPVADAKPAKSAVAAVAAPHAAAAPSLVQVQAHTQRAGPRQPKQQLRGSKGQAVAEMLKSESTRLRSPVLASMASKVLADPFGKVKGLIQQLIQRLLDEATQEATKQGYCDTELGKAKKDRDHRLDETKRISTDLKELTAKKDELNQTIVELEEKIPTLYDDLNSTQEQRATEKTENLEAIELAKEGAKAVKSAINTLKLYYSKAGRAKVLLQASPVDDDTDGPGFSGAYKGKQAGANGIVGMLEVIESDFVRTAKQTEEAEAKAHAEFVEFERTSKEDISAKETSLELSTEDLKATKAAIEGKLEDLTAAQELVDKALEAIEDLKPMCIDMAMSYEDRKAKREEEIAALKEALCLLDPEGNEPDCGGR